MLFARRVRDAFASIRGADWILLSLETASVVTGILIAFSLNEWGASRKEAKVHRQLMERVLEESAFDVFTLADLADSLGEMTRKETAFEVAVEAGHCPAPSEWVSVGTHGLYPAVIAPTSVYQELMSAGGLSAVENRFVRIALAEFHATLDWTHRQVKYFRAARIDVVDDSDPRISIRYDPDKVESIETYDTHALCADRKFRNRLAAATRTHVVFASYYQQLKERALRMCAAIGEDLGKPCAGQFPSGMRAPRPDELKIIQETEKEMRKAGKASTA